VGFSSHAKSSAGVDLVPSEYTQYCLFLSKQGFLALGEDCLDLLGRQSSGRFYRCRMQSAAAPFLSPRTGLLVFPLGTLTSQAFACAS
jgi:hypothetical protein